MYMVSTKMKLRPESEATLRGSHKFIFGKTIVSATQHTKEVSKMINQTTMLFIISIFF